ncbi:MAG: deoxyribose-phosphate aldolase [Anaerolineales bacterium]|nr:deoxyribose-phosphate aldolase [Anaerolineales bacterium]
MPDIKRIVELAKTYQEKLPEPPPALDFPTGKQIAGWIDHTLLKPDATAGQVTALCREGLEYRFASVCVNPVFAPLAAGILRDSEVKVCVVLGFPLGAELPTVKTFQALSSIQAGAQEIDMVINIGALKGEAYGLVYNDVRSVVEIAHTQGALVKVILEMALLDQFEKIVACLLCKEAEADFVKTSTGFSIGGATVDDVQLMYRLVGRKLKIKAAGGIRTYSDAKSMIYAGASRIGASSGVIIVQEAVG